LWRSPAPGAISATYVPLTSTSVTGKPFTVRDCFFAAPLGGFPSACCICPTHRWMLASTLPPWPPK
jgi:hypothetical protein